MTPPDPLRALLPAEGYRQAVAVLEEYRRRAKAGRRPPREVKILLVLDAQTGEVIEVEVPRRYGR